MNDTITSQTGGIEVKNLILVQQLTLCYYNTDGEFINEDGKISESTMKVQMFILSNFLM